MNNKKTNTLTTCNIEKAILKVCSQYNGGITYKGPQDKYLLESNKSLRVKDALQGINEMKEYTHSNRFILVVRECGAELYDENILFSKSCIQHISFTSIFYKNEKIYRIELTDRDKDNLTGTIRLLNNKKFRENVEQWSVTHKMCTVKIITTSGSEYTVTIPVTTSIYSDSLKKCGLSVNDVHKFYYLDFFNDRECI